MAIFASEILSEILKELEDRENAVKSPLIDKFSFASRIPYVILESNAVDSINGNSNKLAKSNVLYGGSPDFLNSIENFDSLFKNTKDVGKRPHPGITSISINNKGTLGSIREATINFSCWSLEELENLTVLYLNPGVYLSLQWGFSRLDEPAKNNSIFKGEHSISKFRDRDAIVTHVKRSKGNYDCMVGPCSTFSWKMNQNGGFDCTTTIISPASFVFSFAVNQSGNQDNLFYLWATNSIDTLEGLIKAKEDIKEDDTVAIQKSEVQIKLITDMKEKLETIFGSSPNLKGAANQAVIKDTTNNENFLGGGSSYYKYLILPSEGELAQLGEELRYISLGHLCTLINSVLFYSNTTNDQITAINNSVTTSNGTSANKADFIKKGLCYIDLNTDEAVCRNHELLKSFVPNEVLIINTSAEKWTPDNLSLSSILKNTKNKPMIEYDYKKVEFSAGKTSPIYDAPMGRFGFGRTKAIYINIVTVSRILKESSEISTFIDNILRVINSSVDDIFHLVRFNDENEPLAIKILDTTLISKDKLIHSFNVYNPNTVVKNITLDGNLPSSFQAAAYVANTAGNAANRDIRLSHAFGRYTNGFRDLDVSSKDVNPEGDLKEAKADEEKRKADMNACKLLQLYDMSAAIYQKTYCLYIKDETRHETIAFAGFPIGINLNITIDGISGIYVGNLFNVTYVPKFLTKNVCFQITNVSHQVDSSGWSTTLTGLLLPIKGAKIIPISKSTPPIAIPQKVKGKINVVDNKTGASIDITNNIKNSSGPDI